MFWRRIEQSTQGQGQEELRTFITERLRVALEFATLGAYDLLGQPEAEQTREQAPAEAPVRADAAAAPRCASVPRDPRAHVGSSNVPCARIDGALVPPECPQLRDSGSSVRGRTGAKGGRDRRGGSIPPSHQPCTWAGR
jgi:hypothetical protein